MKNTCRRIYHQRRISLGPLLCLAWVVVIVAAASAFAHDPGLSAVDLKISADKAFARLTFSRAEIATLVPIDSDRDGLITDAEIDSVRPALGMIAREALTVLAGNRMIVPDQVTALPGESNAIYFDLSFNLSEADGLQLASPLIGRLARGHRQYLRISDNAGGTVGEKLLDAANNTYRLDPAALNNLSVHPRSFRGFFMLGIEHILLGLDHLAFLFALLLMGGTLREAAKIITSFTVAHSITLALATFNLFNLPVSLVEPMIAVSIIYVGLENILRREINHRWLLTFAFGLIHGFGFASILREIGINAGGQALMPLISFNFGVEIGQIAIAAFVLPLIWKLRREPGFVLRYAPACSMLIVLAGAYWLIERTLW